jgi:hypothetical protein
VQPTWAIKIPDATGNRLQAEKRCANHNGMFTTASEILDFIGDEALAARVSVKSEAIRKARGKGKIPSLWYDACEQLAGRPLPRHLFSFKGMETQ